MESEGLGLRLAANTAVQGAGTIAGAVIGLATFLVLTRGLGPTLYGDFAAATAYLFIPVVVADVGLTAGILREISAAPERTEEAMRAFIPLSAIVSVVTVSVMTAVGLLLPFAHETKIAIAIGSIGALLTLLTLSLGPVMQARLQLHWPVGGMLLGRLVTLALVLGAFAAGYGFKSAVAAQVIGIGITFFVSLYVVARQISLRPRFAPRYWRHLVRSSASFGVANALGQINFRVDTVLLALFRTPQEVGYYSAAYKFVEFAHSLTGAVGVTIFPSLNRFAATGDTRLRALVQRSVDVLLAAAAPLMLLFVFYAGEILSWTTGESFTGGAVALQLLAAFLPFGFVGHVVWRVQAAFREDRLLLAVAASSLAVAVALDAALIPSFGMKAAALVTVGVEAGAVALSMLVLAARHAVVPRVSYLATIAAAIAPAALIALFAPVPAAVSAPIALAAYGLAIVLLPGTVRTLAARTAGAARLFVTRTGNA